MSALGLRTCIYKVDDIAAAKKWFADAFEAQPYFDEAFYVGFNVGGYELGLLPDSRNKARSDNVMTYWGVENIEAEVARFLELGATVHEEPTNVGGDIVTASVLDPWGNAIGLIYNPEFGNG